jgi:membrane dipeptidase
MRLVDLHCDWLWQYAGETTLFEPSAYTEVPERLPALDGYLLGASAAILFCSRKPGGWSAQSDPWGALGDLVARYESEFAGRLLIGPDDLVRFGAELADGLCWGMLGIGGLDFLVREPADLDRLAGAFGRGVRVFQLVGCPDNVLGGSAAYGDERSLTGLGSAVLDRLLELAPPAGQSGPRPSVDLAGLNVGTTAEVLKWFEQDLTRCERVVLLSSFGPHRGLAPECLGTIGASADTTLNLRRFRNLGGVIGLSPGPPPFTSAEALREAIEAIAAIPYRGRAGYEGIGIGTNFFRVGELLPELLDVIRLTEWLAQTFGPDDGRDLGERSARKLLARVAGGASDASGQN